MGDFPSNVGANGESCVPDDAAGLKDTRQPSKSSGSDDWKERFVRGQGCGETVYAGGDFCYAGKCGSKDGRNHGKGLNPSGKDGEKHDVTANEDHGLAGRANGFFQRHFPDRTFQAAVCGSQRGSAQPGPGEESAFENSVNAIEMSGHKGEGQNRQIKAGEKKHRRYRKGKCGSYISKEEHGAWMVCDSKKIGGLFGTDSASFLKICAHFGA